MRLRGPAEVGGDVSSFKFHDERALCVMGGVMDRPAAIASRSGRFAASPAPAVEAQALAHHRRDDGYCGDAEPRQPEAALGPDHRLLL